MSREDIVAVAARLFSIFVFFGLLRNVPGAAQMLSGQHGMAWIALYGVLLALGLDICALLWFFPLTVARKLLPVLREPRSEQAIDSSIALSLGMTLMGLWLLADAVIDSAHWLALVIRIKQTGLDTIEWTPQQIAGVVATVTQLAIATWLLLGNAGIRRLIYKYRYGDS